MKNDILFLNLNSDNHGQKSWNKFTFVAHFHTGQTNSQARIHFTPPPPPHLYIVGHVYTLILQRFNIVWGLGEGGKQRILKRKNNAFSIVLASLFATLSIFG